MAPPKAGAPPKACRAVKDYLNLSRFRQKTGLTLEQIAERTKISMRFLRAIEDGDYEKLPGGIFTTSYLRQYAQAIGFDEAVLISHFSRAIAPPVIDAPGNPVSRNILDRWFRINAPAQ
jgi:transcriptional regulator with XRE-family HTH domain